MAGVLQKLRNAVLRKEPVEVTPKAIRIGDGAELDRKARTNFNSMRGRGEAYLLDAIYFQYKFQKLPYNEYIEACNREGAMHVKMLDKKDIIAYLSGEVSSCAGLVDEAPAPATVSAPLPLQESVPKAPSPLDVTLDDDIADIGERRFLHRDQRTLDSVLMLADADFSALRDKLATHISNAKRGKPQSAAEKSERQRRSETVPTFDPRGDRYTDNQDRFWRENMGTDFKELGINPMGSFAAAPIPTPAPGASAPKPRPAPPARPASRGGKRKAADISELWPIIIVPGPGTSLISSANAKEFVENGHFISEEDMRKKGIAPDLSGRVTALRTPGGNCSAAEYHIVSNINRLTDSEWKRVVGVVCTGKEWQFRNWPLGKGPVEIFTKVQGFFFHYDDQTPDVKASSWAIKLIPLSRTKRHTDGHAQLQFWGSLDQFIKRSAKRVRY